LLSEWGDGIIAETGIEIRAKSVLDGFSGSIVFIKRITSGSRVSGWWLLDIAIHGGRVIGWLSLGVIF
jgi:hypothetical protein